ncbi:hypothetical protein [Picosynechococcus sp. PCC 7117]|uniref:hypothetical protein n=1 Tax=Picosynechococcus sp. PCC 7117 TaxID=195498 RepID=UPI0008108AC7|nr:hypothetical protein [Picosynechococcus sp. PCC 7117]ANV86565.1 hypothetical protein AWQ22_03245 [Picosynechococcus sp. PCC 7117]
MDFKQFSEFLQFIRRHNSTSVLEIGTKKCWQNWEVRYANPLDWVLANTERNYAVRIMLLASAGNPHRHQSMDTHVFDNLVNAYHNWDRHTISDRRILDEEEKILLNSIMKWEGNPKNKKQVRNWSVKLSEILDSSVVHAHIAGLFVQRLGAFQNAGFGHPVSRLHRTIKLIELLDSQSNQEFSETFSNYVGLSPTNYFRQFLACLALFGWLSGKRGFCNFSRLPDIDNQLQESGITSENLKLFIQQNSAPHSAQTDTSFRGKITKTLDSVPEYYQPLFYNHFLEIPFVELRGQEFCLPDPFSFTESCWNQVRGLISKSSYGEKLNHLLSCAFEDYLEKVLFPFICASSFEKIPEVKNPNSNKDKRADFLVETSSSYIVIECKSCVMHSDTSAYFQADRLADLWCRIHSAFEQIGITVEALNLHDKPVIPLILTFYDSIAASTVFEEMVKQTEYCSLMRVNMPPIVQSLHEFEHWTLNRSLNNWSELILSKQNADSPVSPDHKGHGYGHLSGVSIL